MKKSLYPVWLLLSMLAGCNFAPKYSRPDTALPSEWRVDSEPGDELANLNWWELWEDAVLNGYIQTALENNKDLKVAMWRVNQYLGQWSMARSRLLPQIDLNGSAEKERFPIDLDFLPIRRDPVSPNYELDLTLAYELDFWGKVRNTSSAAYSDYLAQVENRRTVILTLVGSVAQSYVTLRQLDLQLVIAKETLESRKESLEIATDRFEGGVTSRIEEDQAKSVYEESAVVVANLERLIQQQENLLCVLLGEAPKSLERGKSLTELQLPNAVPSAHPSDVLTRRPDILKVENTLKAANANIGVARAIFFPQINLTGLYGVDSLELKSLFDKSSVTWIIGGSLLQKIFTGGRLFAQLRVAKAKQKEMVYQYQQTILTALQEVDDALIGLQKSKEIVSASRKEVEALQDYLQLAWYRYYEGDTQYLTVLDAERRVFSAKLTLAGYIADQFQFLVDLYKSLGGGWVLDADKQVMEHFTQN